MPWFTVEWPMNVHGVPSCCMACAGLKFLYWSLSAQIDDEIKVHAHTRSCSRNLMRGSFNWLVWALTKAWVAHHEIWVASEKQANSNSLTKRIGKYDVVRLCSSLGLCKQRFFSWGITKKNPFPPSPFFRMRWVKLIKLKTKVKYYTNVSHPPSQRKLEYCRICFYLYIFKTKHMLFIFPHLTHEFIVNNTNKHMIFS